MYMLYDGMKMRESIEMVLKSPKKDGLYMPSCLSHVGKCSHRYPITYGTACPIAG